MKRGMGEGEKQFFPVCFLFYFPSIRKFQKKNPEMLRPVISAERKTYQLGGPHCYP